MAVPARVSVLIPCYNGAAYLGEALTSIFAQSYQSWEAIVVDDGSTDPSAVVAKGFGPRVRVVRQDHQGISAARNRALGLATAELIAFLDADDLWPPESLGRRVAALVDPGVDAAGGLVEEFLSPELTATERNRRTVLPEALPGRLLGALVIRRELFARVGEFEASYTLAGDLDWIARAEALGWSCRGSTDVVLRRRIHLGNTGSLLRNKRGDYLRMLRAALDRQRHRTAMRPPS